MGVARVYKSLIVRDRGSHALLERRDGDPIFLGDFMVKCFLGWTQSNMRTARKSLLVTIRRKSTPPIRSPLIVVFPDSWLTRVKRESSYQAPTSLLRAQCRLPVTKTCIAPSLSPYFTPPHWCCGFLYKSSNWRFFSIKFLLLPFFLRLPWLLTSSFSRETNLLLTSVFSVLYYTPQHVSYTTYNLFKTQSMGWSNCFTKSWRYIKHWRQRSGLYQTIELEYVYFLWSWEWRYFWL